MSKSKTFDRGALIVGASWTVIFLIAFFARMSDTFTIGNDDQVHMSPKMVSHTVPLFIKIMAVVCLGAMWLVIIAGTQGVFEQKNGGNTKGIVALIVVLLASMIFHFAWYSGKADNNYVQITEAQKQVWIASGDITKTGENSYKDITGVLKALFYNKKLIK